MALHRLDKHVKLAATLDEVWAFFSDPRNLPVITPPSLGLRITSPVPGEMYPGMIITYSVSPIAGIRLQWVTEVTHVVDRRLFVDEQRSGPYRFWHHQHHFREVPGGIEVRDLVHYALPGGPLGPLVNALAVRRRLADVFAFRERVLAQRFGVVGVGGGGGPGERGGAG